VTAAIDTDEFRMLLTDRRDRIVRAIEHLHEQHPGALDEETGELVTVDNHLADLASATFDRELDLGLEEDAEEVLAAIDAALGRLDMGTFGICARCGAQIGVERLRAMPYTTLCIDCKRREERM
jgi:RNA polymerase-binding protein DksA